MSTSCQNNPCFCEKLNALHVRYKFDPISCIDEGWFIREIHYSSPHYPGFFISLVNEGFELANGVKLIDCVEANDLYEYNLVRSGWAKQGTAS